MSRVKRTFSAEFKTKIVLEIIEGKKTINEIASENSLQPNLIRKWKKEFLDRLLWFSMISVKTMLAKNSMRAAKNAILMRKRLVSLPCR